MAPSSWPTPAIIARLRSYAVIVQGRANYGSVIADSGGVRVRCPVSIPEAKVKEAAINDRSSITRRRALGTGLALAAGLAPGVAAAARLLATPFQTPGPFYPRELPLDTDNDLVRVRGRAAQAQGQILHVFGRILDRSGRPLAGARVEIWQCDAHGVYHHPGDRRGGLDRDFQGYGQTGADAGGAYRFRTIRPVPYPGRTPHIHFAVSGTGLGRFTTQMYEQGHPLNEGDFVLGRVPAGNRGRLMVAFEPAPEIETGALKGSFDIVLGS